MSSSSPLGGYAIGDSTAHSSSLSAITSYGVAGSTANSSGLSATVSYGLVGSTANSSGLSATTSLGVASSTGLSSALSATVSYGLVGSTANSSGLSATTSLGLASSTGLSSALSATVSYGLVGSTANSSGLSATVSLGTAGSTAHSSSLSAVVSLGTALGGVHPVLKTSTIADTSLTNNTQVAGNTIATATSGDIYIEDIIIAKDGTALTGPTNIEITSDNTYGDTGVNDPVALVSTATLAGTTRVGGTGTAVFSTLKFPMKLESGKKLYIHGDDAAGTSGGNISYIIKGFGPAGSSLA